MPRPTPPPSWPSSGRPYLGCKSWCGISQLSRKLGLPRPEIDRALRSLAAEDKAERALLEAGDKLAEHWRIRFVTRNRVAAE